MSIKEPMTAKERAGLILLRGRDVSCSCVPAGRKPYEGHVYGYPSGCTWCRAVWHLTAAVKEAEKNYFLKLNDEVHRWAKSMGVAYKDVPFCALWVVHPDDTTGDFPNLTPEQLAKLDRLAKEALSREVEA